MYYINTVAVHVKIPPEQCVPNSNKLLIHWYRHSQAIQHLMPSEDRKVSKKHLNSSHLLHTYKSTPKTIDKF